MEKRTQKFYSANEKKTLRLLGLTPAPMSGAGWVIKEDGESETTMVQLKSTDSSSYRINMLDLKKLEYHAATSNKVPVFLIQFLQQNKTYAMIDVNLIEDLDEAIKLKKAPDRVMVKEAEEVIKREEIKFCKNARNAFMKEKEEGFARRKKYN